MSGLKSSWELSLERSDDLVPELKSKKKLTKKQKEQIAEIRKEYAAKIADIDVTIQDKIRKLPDRVPPEEIAEAKKVKLEELKHPEKDEDRVKKDEWLVMLGVCTHLGCVPLTDKGDYNAWFCPCHGSHYDTSGRIRKGPAPTNLEIPKYEFVNNNTIKIG